VLVAAVSAFLTGHFQVLDLGSITATITLPSLFLLGLTFFHLVVRRGRKFNQNKHEMIYEAFKALIFTGLAYSFFRSGVSTTQNSLVPQNIFGSFLSVFFLCLALYLMAYRPNR
jgi:preprotein translocase subunit YajC